VRRPAGEQGQRDRPSEHRHSHRRPDRSEQCSDCSSLCSWCSRGCSPERPEVIGEIGKAEQWSQQVWAEQSPCRRPGTPDPQPGIRSRAGKTCYLQGAFQCAGAVRSRRQNFCNSGPMTGSIRY
jgi:hypothetical protein